MPRNEKLRLQRTLRNWRQQDLADQLEVTLTTIQRWERGIQEPRTYYRVKLCDLFGLPAEELGLSDEDQPLLTEDSEPDDASTTPVSPAFSKRDTLWTIPYPRNPHFTGRKDLLATLEQQFAPTPFVASTGIRRAALTQSQAITGLGGIGKTQLAIEYAYRAREQERYTHTLWINAASEDALLSNFAALKALLPAIFSHEENDQRILASKVLRWLEQCQEPWLLIYDNADDPSFLPTYLPVRGNGSILLTSRAHITSVMASSLEIEPLSMEEATQLLLQRAQCEAEIPPQEREDASTIAMALGMFPLAIDQAGAYIEETGCNLHDYLAIFHQHRYELLVRRGKQAHGYPESVATTWDLSFQRVEAANPAAAELLRLCAFLAPDQIPEELLIGGAAYWPATLQQAVADRYHFNQMLEALLAFSLVKRVGQTRQLGLHRLVQVVQRERMPFDEQRQWAERVVRAVNAIFPRESQDMRCWTECSYYLAHVQACDALVQLYQLQLPEAADVLDRAGTYLRERALYALAESLYRQALHIWDAQAEQHLVEKAHSMNNLALLYYWQDKLAQAEALYRQALAIREQQLGPEHLDVAESLNGLAGLYRMQGKFAAAEVFYQRALHIYEQQPEVDHVLVAEVLSGLATLYEKQGKYTVAEPFYVRALGIREQQLGSEHPLVAESLNDLSVLYASMQGKHTETESLAQRALHIYEQLGADHPMVAYPLLNLATEYSVQRRYAEAEPLYRRALSILEQQLGKMHRNLVNPLTGLASLYQVQGKYEQAEALYQRALHICEQQLGPEHPRIIVVINGLASLFVIQQKLTDAERLYQRSVATSEQRLGPEHRDLARSLNGLAHLYAIQKRDAEAEVLYQRALHIFEHQLGPAHSETGAALYDVARFWHQQGRIAEAAVLYQRVLAIYEQDLGSDHPLTVETRTYIHHILQASGQPEQATH